MTGLSYIMRVDAVAFIVTMALYFLFRISDRDCSEVDRLSNYFGVVPFLLAVGWFTCLIVKLFLVGVLA